MKKSKNRVKLIQKKKKKKKNIDDSLLLHTIIYHLTVESESF